MRLTTTIIIAIALIVGGILLYALYDKQGFDAFVNSGTGRTSEVKSTPPEEVVDPETGEVDQELFEQNQDVNENDSLETLETELDSTIILEEDLSDL